MECPLNGTLAMGTLRERNSSERRSDIPEVQRMVVERMKSCESVDELARSSG